MDTDLTMQMVAMNTGTSRAAAQTAMLKKSLDIDRSMADMVAQSVQAAPPAGQGLKVDKTA